MEWQLLWLGRPNGSLWSCLCQWTQWIKDSITSQEERQNSVPLSRTWKVPPHLYATLLYAQGRRQMDHAKWQLRIANSIKQWLTAAAVPDVLPLLEQMNTSPGTWNAAIDLANDLSLVPAHKDQQKGSAVTWQWQRYTFTALLQGYINPLALCHDFIWRFLGHLSLPQNITVVHFSDKSMLLNK